MSEPTLKDRVNELRERVAEIQSAVDELRDSGLSLRTVVLLLSRSTGVGMRDIHAVLNGIDTFIDDHFDDGEET